MSWCSSISDDTTCFEGHAVTLEERRSLRLTVVGEHHHVIRAGRLADRLFEAAELLVEPAQRVHRRLGEDARVVGDLVVPDEVGVRRGHAAVDIAHQRVQREVAQDRGGRGAQHRIDAAAFQARFDLEAAGVASVDHLPHDVGDGQGEQPAHRVRVGQHVVRRVLAVLGAVGDRAEREDRILAVAGEHVRPRHATVDEQAVAVGLAVLDDRRIAGPVRREHLAEVLVVPAERRHVLVVAVEDAGLARPGLRRQVALPSGDLMGAAAQPAGQCRHGAGGDRPSQDGFGEAVDLQEEHAGDVGRGGRLEAVDHPPHRLALEHGVVVEREHAADDDRSPRS